MSAMQSPTPVEIADRLSRQRAIGAAVAAAAFLIVQLVARPFFLGGREPTRGVAVPFWAINAGALLLLLATRGGLLHSRKVQALVDDEITRANYRSAVLAGYWVAMLVAMGLYIFAGFDRFDAREAVYVIVTPSISVALLVFAWLEWRALGDG